MATPRPIPAALIADPVTEVRLNLALAVVTPDTFGTGVGMIRGAGQDITPFLHNRTTSDVKSLQPGQGQPCALVDKGAHIQALFSLHQCSPTDYWLLTPGEMTTSLMESALKFKIMEDVTLTDVSSEHGFLLLVGQHWNAVLQDHLTDSPEADPCRQFLNAPEPNGIFTPEGSLFEDAPDLTALIHSPYVWSGSGANKMATICLIFPSKMEEKWQKTAEKWAKNHQKQPFLAPKFIKMTPTQWDQWRLESGIPAFGPDYSHDTLLPQTGQEAPTVSYTKGCFLGQETLARVKTYGSVPKALVGLKQPGNQDIPSPQTPLVVDGKEVGLLQSALYSPALESTIALAYLHRDHRSPGTTVQINGSEWTVCSLPFIATQSFQEKWAKACHQWGSEAFLNENHEEALHSFRMAITIYPGLTDGYESLGVVLGRLDRFDEAIEAMNALLEKDSASVMAHTNLSVYYMKLGDKERAEDEKAKATMQAFQNKMKEAGGLPNLPQQGATPSIAPSIPIASQAPATEPPLDPKRAQDIRDRIPLFENALQFSPEDPLTHYGLGSAYVELQEYAKAIPFLEKTIELQPEHSQAHAMLGQCLEQTGNIPAALAIYKAGIQVASKRGDLMPLQAMEARQASLSEA